GCGCCYSGDRTRALCRLSRSNQTRGAPQPHAPFRCEDGVGGRWSFSGEAHPPLAGASFGSRRSGVVLLHRLRGILLSKPSLNRSSGRRLPDHGGRCHPNRPDSRETGSAYRDFLCRYSVWLHHRAATSALVYSVLRCSPRGRSLLVVDSSWEGFVSLRYLDRQLFELCDVVELSRWAARFRALSSTL